MPRTIDEGFRDFLKTLTASSYESEAARKHRASIESCLESNFGLLRFFRIGSFGNGTSISGYSDVDYFASLPNSSLTQSSEYTLRKVRNALDTRFPSTGVSVNCPAVSVPFGYLVSESTEVVPAEYLGEETGFKVYDIADCADGWMRSSPDAHNGYVRNIDQKLFNKVKPLIRFMKAWKFFRQVPITSFYLELQVARYCYDERAIVYSIDLHRILKRLYENSLARMQDPACISGYISPCKSEAQRTDALSKTLTAYVRAEKAREAEVDGDIKSAFDWWDLVFDGKFPSYYY